MFIKFLMMNKLLSNSVLKDHMSLILKVEDLEQAKTRILRDFISDINEVILVQGRNELIIKAEPNEELVRLIKERIKPESIEVSQEKPLDVIKGMIWDELINAYGSNILGINLDENVIASTPFGNKQPKYKVLIGYDSEDKNELARISSEIMRMVNGFIPSGFRVQVYPRSKITI